MDDVCTVYQIIRNYDPETLFDRNNVLKNT